MGVAYRLKKGVKNGHKMIMQYIIKVLTTDYIHCVFRVLQIIDISRVLDLKSLGVRSVPVRVRPRALNFKDLHRYTGLPEKPSLMSG